MRYRVADLDETFQPVQPGVRWFDLAPVHVWRFALRGELAAWPWWSDRLTTGEIEAVQRYRRPEDQERALISRGARRHLIAEVCACAPEDVDLGVGLHGKPSCQSPRAGRTDLEFNVSHSGAWVLVAISMRGAVGVDIEQHRPVEEERLVADCFSPEEAMAWRALPPKDRTAGFYATWTRKEAYLKGLGVGLGKALDRFSVTVDPSPMAHVVVHDDDDPTATDRWAFWPLPIDGNHSASLVVAGRPSSVCRWEWPGHESPVEA